MSAIPAPEPASRKTPLKQRTLLDVYANRDLTEAQVRRLVVLLRLTEPRPVSAEAA